MGAGGRYLLGGWLHLQLGNGFTWGTFAVNGLGSLMIGPVFGLAQAKSISPSTTLFLTVGVLGGFTTFSAFSYETLRLSARSLGRFRLFLVGDVARCLRRSRRETILPKTLSASLTGLVFGAFS